MQGILGNDAPGVSSIQVGGGTLPTGEVEWRGREGRCHHGAEGEQPEIQEETQEESEAQGDGPSRSDQHVLVVAEAKVSKHPGR